MPKRHTITLSTAQTLELEEIIATHPKPYMRERAAALLKVGAGKSAHAVALDGLLRVRDPDTVYAWLKRYAAEGLAGLQIRPGRGRKPAFSPSAPNSG